MSEHDTDMAAARWCKNGWKHMANYFVREMSWMEHENADLQYRAERAEDHLD